MVVPMATEKSNPTGTFSSWNSFDFWQTVSKSYRNSNFLHNRAVPLATENSNPTGTTIKPKLATLGMSWVQTWKEIKMRDWDFL